MRYIKMVGLTTMAAIAAMALATSASATILTSPGETPYTGQFAAQAGEITLHGVATYTCNKSHATGEVEQHGSSVTARGKLTTWTLSECNGHVAIKKLGTVEIHTEKEGSNGNGTVTVSGTEVESVSTSMGITCIFTTENTFLGTLTGSNTTGGTAVLMIESAAIPRTGGSIFCGSTGELTGSYTVTTPDALYID